MLFPGMEAEQSELVRLSAPYLTMSHQATTVGVDYDSGRAQAIAITATNAKHPLVALAKFHDAAGGFATRMRLERTSRVNAYVLTARGPFAASRIVKVTRGGYGTNVD
jgi:predicted secreted protein